ncbi:hypothetical protein [Halovivax limisalsi]|uniref:hypothetical protein n=1 Tax=Halovivax limisalsi TaxID=1453760 RepID=UPI001FFD16B2|nr:hypothetical protein [Halovivax limisalsi]
MIGEHAFCPHSGASLSREAHYDARGRPERAPQPADRATSAALDAPLTTGAVRSSKRALTAYFRRCHGRHGEPDEALYRRGALALGRLKEAASGRDARDEIVWYALGERLARSDFDVEWMAAHAEPRCPGCNGRLAYVEGPNGPIGRCGGSCRPADGDRLETVRTLVRSLFERTFPDVAPPDTDDLALL